MGNYAIFVLQFAVYMLAAVFLGLWLFGGDIHKHGWRKSFRMTYWKLKPSNWLIIGGLFKRHWQYLMILVLFFASVLLENWTHPLIADSLIDFTPAVYALEGDLVLSSQRAMYAPGLLTEFFSRIYMFAFNFLLFFTPWLFIWRGDTRMMRFYSMAFLVNLLILVPFYVLFPVRTPGMYEPLAREGMLPVLYSDPHYLEMVKAVDPLDNCFPSGHISMPTTMVLVLWLYGRRQYRTYRFFVGWSALFIALSTIYLGIHWYVDILAGVGIAIFATWLTTKPAAVRWFVRTTRYMDFFKRGDREYRS